MVNAGTLIATNSDAIADGTSLTVGAGGRFVFDPSAGAAPVANGAVVAAVPEPGTLALLAAGLVVAWGAWRRGTGLSGFRCGRAFDSELLAIGGVYCVVACSQKFRAQLRLRNHGECDTLIRGTYCGAGWTGGPWTYLSLSALRK